MTSPLIFVNETYLEKGGWNLNALQYRSSTFFSILDKNDQICFSLIPVYYKILPRNGCEWKTLDPPPAPGPLFEEPVHIN